MEPILELYRGKLYCNILRFFIKSCLINLNKDIFNIKKSYSRTLTNLLSSWLFTNYMYRKNDDDIFFPSDFKHYEQLKKTLFHFSTNSEFDNIDSKINKIIYFLDKSYSDSLNYLNQYKKSEYYNKIKNNYEIKKEIIFIKNIQYYKFYIKKKFYIKEKRLTNILNNIFIPMNEYNKCKKFYNGPIHKFDTVLWIILFRYQLLGSNNHQLGVLPNILKQMNKDFNLNIECFASAINCTFPNFCSIYYDVEKYFGSKGSFFDLEIKSGVYGFNPPYQEDIIENGINKLFDKLKIINKLTFIITIPVWDNYGKNLMNVENDINYGDFDIINKIRESEYFKGLVMIPKEEFTYLDHNFNLYKNVTIQNTYIIVLSNYNNNYIDTIKTYNFMDI